MSAESELGVTSGSSTWKTMRRTATQTTWEWMSLRHQQASLKWGQHVCMAMLLLWGRICPLWQSSRAMGRLKEHFSSSLLQAAVLSSWGSWGLMLKTVCWVGEELWACNLCFDTHSFSRILAVPSCLWERQGSRFPQLPAGRGMKVGRRQASHTRLHTLWNLHRCLKGRICLSMANVHALWTGLKKKMTYTDLQLSELWVFVLTKVKTALCCGVCLTCKMKRDLVTPLLVVIFPIFLLDVVMSQEKDSFLCMLYLI